MNVFEVILHHYFMPSHTAKPHSVHYVDHSKASILKAFSTEKLLYIANPWLVSKLQQMTFELSGAIPCNKLILSIEIWSVCKLISLNCFKIRADFGQDRNSSQHKVNFKQFHKTWIKCTAQNAFHLEDMFN